jgi:type IV secretory pathway TrbL component
MDWLKWPLLVLGTLYVAFLMTMNGFFSRVPYDLLEKHEKYLLIWYFIRNVVLVGIVGWLFINRPWQRKTRLSEFKISRKIN